jgi:hypothetical protein
VRHSTLKILLGAVPVTSEYAAARSIGAKIVLMFLEWPRLDKKSAKDMNAEVKLIAGKL